MAGQPFDRPAVSSANLAPARSVSPPLVEFKKLLDRYLGIPLHLLVHAVDVLGSPFRPSADIREVRHIALVKLWGIGNLAMILPYTRALRRQFPGARLTFVTLQRNRSLLVNHPLLDQVLTLRDDGFLRTLTDLCRITRQLRRNPPDLFLDFEQFLRITGLLARFSRTRHAIGFETPGQARARLHQARVPYDDQRHMAEVFGDIVRATGASIDCLPPLEVPRDPAAAQRTAQQLKGLPRPWMVFHPGSGDNFPGRRWPAERFIEAGVLLQQRFPGTLFLTGSKAEQQLLTQIQAGLQQRGVESISLAGQLTLPDLVAWMDAVDFLLTNDTGPVHLASAVGTPVVALYGPNTPLLYGPLGDRCKALYHALPCSPCLTNQNAKTSQCRLPACILALSVAEVVQAASELLLQTDAPQTTKVQQ